MTGPSAAPPLVSVVIPAHNAGENIGAAVDSVIAQTYADWEVVLCDDGSTDATVEIVRAHLRPPCDARLRIVPLRGAGPGGARNAGIRLARGEWIAFLDDDDAWEPAKLTRSMEAIREGALDLVCHSEVWDDGRSRRVHHYSALFDRNVAPPVSLFRNNPFSTSAVVVRRQRLLDAGLFDETLPSAEDYDLWIRLVLLPGFRLGFLDEALGTYRVRPGSESSRTDRRLRALLAIGRKYAPALRASGRLGALEHWKFVARSYLTSGLRYVRQGRPLRGVLLAALGAAMWPWRLDWIRRVLHQHPARRPG